MHTEHAHPRGCGKILGARIPHHCWKKYRRALSSAGLERLPYKQEVGGSNPSAPISNSLSNKHLQYDLKFDILDVDQGSPKGHHFALVSPLVRCTRSDCL